MARRPTPRPTVTAPAVVRAGEAVEHRWGDAVSGLVGDEVLLSSERLHALIFTLAPGARFGHSPDNRTVFRADEVYLVLEGTLLAIDPERGQVVRANAGDCVFFRRDTWHHGVNDGTTAVRVLELFAPPPAAGASSEYARTRPYLEDPIHADDTLLGRWPMDRAAIEADDRLTLVRPMDWRLRLEADLVVGLVAATEHLTAAVADLRAGGSGPLRAFGGDVVVHVTAGTVHAHVPDGDRTWFSIRAGDTFLVPAGVAFQLVNQGSEPARMAIGAAPAWLPSGESAPA